MDELDLLHEIVRSTHWQWMKGLVLRDGRTVSDVRGDPHGVWLVLARGGMATTTLHVLSGQAPWHTYLPDIDSPATKGCLLQMIRDAAGAAEAHAPYHYYPLGSLQAGWAMSVGNRLHTDESEGRLLARVLLYLPDPVAEEAPPSTVVESWLVTPAVLDELREHGWLPPEETDHE